MTARTYDRIVKEPIPWKKHAVVFHGWRKGACEWCGNDGWLRFWKASMLFECLNCWLGHTDRLNGSHGREDDKRLYWLWTQVQNGAL